MGCSLGGPSMTPLVYPRFSESVDYLRELGALDESDPANKAPFVAE